MSLKIFLSSLLLIVFASSAMARPRDYRYHGGYNHPPVFQPYYYQPGFPLPPLVNPYNYNFRGVVCFAQSPNGWVFWGGGINPNQASANALNICSAQTGYYCYPAGCNF